VITGLAPKAQLPKLGGRGLPSLRQGLPTFPKAGRQDTDLPAAPYAVPRYPNAPIRPGQGAWPVPGATSISGGGRANALALLRTGPSAGRDDTTKLMINALTGGGRPQGPAVQGYVNQLVQTLLQGY